MKYPIGIQDFKTIIENGYRTKPHWYTVLLQKDRFTF